MASLCLRSNSGRNRATRGGEGTMKTTVVRLIEHRLPRLLFSCLTLLLFAGCEIQARLVHPAFSHPKQRRQSKHFSIEAIIPPLPRSEPTPTAVTAIEQSPVPAAESGPGLPVVYTNDPTVVSRWLADNVPTEGCTLGFDLESVPDGAPWITRKANFRGPAVVQLATADSSLVIHLAQPNGRPSNSCGPILEALLRDENIVKAGCSVDQDMLELRQRWSTLEARSRLDLGGVGASGHRRLGLKQLSRSILGVDLPKSRRLAMSDWSQVPLTKALVAYSARDAWAGAAIVATLADRDPDTFGTPALVDLLRPQRSIDDLYHRHYRRKEAKNKLTALLAPYSFEEKKRRHVHDSEMPPWKAKVVSDLKCIMKENRAVQVETFDVEPLGFCNLGANKNQTASSGR